MATNVVTSCSAEGWVKYGARFVETYEKFWPPAIQLHVVSEDPLPHKFLKSHGPRFWTLDASNAWKLFRAHNAGRLWVHGDSTVSRPDGITRRWTEHTGYNFRFNAYKFSKKVFAIELLANHLQMGRLLWVDADVLTFAPVPVTLPEAMLPSAYALSCLARLGYHSECGFVGYNLDHSEAMHFIRAFSGLYHTEEVFKLAEWHDSWVFDWLRNKLLTSTYHIPHKSKGHPFINSQLGLYMDHLKGKRKGKGRSPAVECVANSKLPYWAGGGPRI